MPRRSFLTSTLLGAASLGAGFLSGSRPAFAVGPALNAGDVAVLKFLAAAELVECDLWQQYSELATGNPSFRAALQLIDHALPDYVNGDFEDECSHAALINAFLVSRGEAAVNLDAFRTLPSVPLRGAMNIGRLTNLTKLTIDTSYYNRYRGTGNPDLGDTFPQVVTITNQRAVPASNRDPDVRAIAQTAAFHFAAIEQGGSSLYTALIGKATDPDVLAILAAIGPTEVYHFSVFQTSLENIVPLRTKTRPVFPNLARDPKRALTFPHPCHFLNASLPWCSVIRPSNLNLAGAVAAATGLVGSGLFQGQSQGFLNAVVALATAADAAQRV